MRQTDSELEFYWHPHLERWYLYRVVVKGGCPGDDKMMKMLALTGPKGEFRPPGVWALEELKARELRHFSERSHKHATSEYLKKQHKRDRAIHKDRDREQDELTTEMGKSYADCFREKNYVSNTTVSNEIKANPGRTLIHGEGGRKT